ncbi:methyltransferase domain-containing protein [Roseateles sp.]|uniref:class I SAM-dependent methyltransferase n=1 Tax=Roseateles sp. TaxID=1971397 RepID=UPI0025D6F3A7|nr:methyltransferase domain-containing protein [Roseateles sp.]MBV8034397.1 methyltransferase domain-containing protein [Roseateles sp.]
MDARLQLRLQRYGWDRAAARYDASWQRSLSSAHRLLVDRLQLRPGERVLDIACGTGGLACELAAAVGTAGQVVGVDLSQAMVDEANARAAAAGLRNTCFERIDAQSLTLPDAAFDIVTCCFGLMYLPDPERALVQMRRVLRPGGRLGLAVWGERRNCAWAPVFSIIDAEVQSEVCPLFFRFGVKGAMANACRDAGLHVRWQQTLAHSLTYHDADAACDAMFIAGPAALAWSRFDDDSRARVRANYLDAIDAWRGEAGYQLPAQFVCLVADVPPA